MKNVVIPDLHGSFAWKNINPENYYKIIFVADYFDSKNKDNETIFKNFEEVIALKKKWGDKVVLLLGNHDIQYRYLDAPICTGYDSKGIFTYSPSLVDNWNLFQYAYQDEKYLITHAGVCKDWLAFFKEQTCDVIGDFSNTEIADHINMVKDSRFEPLLWKVCGSRQVIQTPVNGGPLWLGKPRLIANALEDVQQIVGHTAVDDITVVGNVTFIDTLWGGSPLRDDYTDFFEYSI